MKNFHGDAQVGKVTRLHNIWRNMLSRCVPRNKYGQRGINVCEDWKDYSLFKEWAIQNGYSDCLSIDRIDNNGDYNPSNCRWVNAKQQARNRRTSRYFTCDGETKTIAEWSEQKGINYNLLRRRIADGFSGDIFSENSVKDKHVIREGKIKKEVKGCYFDKETGRWRADLWFRNKRIRLGRFDTFEEAHAAYVKKKSELI